MSLHRFILGLSAAGLAGLIAAERLSAQEPPPPPASARSAPAPESDAQTAGSPDGAEVYTRGPLHEAFAAPILNQPAEGPLVTKAPPEPIDEVPPDERPEGYNVIWIPGYWEWDAGLEDYLWISGLRRDAPPERRWVPGYWHEVEGGWRRVSGMWMGNDVSELA